MRRWIIIILFALLSLFVYFIYQYKIFYDGNLHITFCNVGQGDSILIRTPKGKNILIDAGPDKSVLNCLSTNLPFWERKLDEVIITHPHSDHYFGMYYVIDRYIASMIDIEDVTNSSVEYQDFLKKIEKKKIKLRILNAGDSFELGDGLRILVAGPTKEYLNQSIPIGSIKEANEQATLILQVSFNSFDMLLTADSEASGIKRALPFISGEIEILQIPHHGSKTGLTKELIKQINPKTALVSVGKNKYGHPSKEILQLLNSEAVKVYRTDISGDIEIMTNGSGYMIQNDMD